MKNILAIIVLNFLLFSISKSQTMKKEEQWDRFELPVHYTYEGNSFTDVNISATFKNKDTSIVVSGFYDGENIFRIRFMPIETGIWNYATSSNIPELNNKKGAFECISAAGNNHGMVKVSDTNNFKYADGKQYYSFGTTAYAWIHMSDGLQEITLNTLKHSGFNKVRMCVFPKNYDLVKTNPKELSDYISFVI